MSVAWSRRSDSVGGVLTAGGEELGFGQSPFSTHLPVQSILVPGQLDPASVHTMDLLALAAAGPSSPATPSRAKTATGENKV